MAKDKTGRGRVKAGHEEAGISILKFKTHSI